MKDLITFIVDGETVSVPKGTLVIEAVKQAGVEIPHFCYHPRLKSDANCRMCLIEIEKVPKLQTSCTTEVSEGMVVRTDSKAVVDSQHGVMEYLLGNHPLDCPECDQGGECQLQDFGHQHSPSGSRFVETKRIFPKEYFGPLIEKEMNRCVSCLRCVRYCDEVMDVKALGSYDRGNGTQIGAFAHGELECEYCGGCVQICPVGALTSRLSMFENRTWQLNKTDTICNYCGDGCSMVLETGKDHVSRIASKTGTGRNDGDLCARGFFGYGSINHEDRLTRPILALSGGRLEVTWQWAFEKMRSDLKAIVAEYGPEAIGGVISAQCTNEEHYLFQKLMRDVIGTPHVDSGARYGFINAMRALTDVFGSPRLSSYEDILSADALLVFAGEMTETNPIVAIKVKEAVRQNKAQLITVAPYESDKEMHFTHLPNMAKQHLEIKMGSENAAILGLTKALLEGSYSAATPPELLEKMKAAAALLSFEAIEGSTGIKQAEFEQAAATYANAKRGVIIFGRSILRSDEGYDSVLRLAEFAVLSGKIGRSGTGLLPLAKENNAFGAVEMGAVPEYGPGLRSLAGQTQGKTLLEMLDAAADGSIKALFFVGENPLRSLPQKNVKSALENLDLLICQDQFPNELTELAHIVLPAASFAEKSGHFTNQEGRVQKVRPGIDAVGNAKPDWDIFSTLIGYWDVAEKTPYQKCGAYKSAEEVWKELVMSMPATWPQASSASLSASISSYVRGSDIVWRLPEAEDSEAGFDLQVGQSLFHAGKLSTYASGLTDLLSQADLLMHPDDAEELGIEEESTIGLSVKGTKDSVELMVRFNQKLSRGTLFVSEHFSLEIKRLLPLCLDPTTGVPSGDRGRVTLSKIAMPV